MRRNGDTERRLPYRIFGAKRIARRLVPKLAWDLLEKSCVGSDDMTGWLYDTTGDKPKEKAVLRVEKTTFGVKELFFTPDGKLLATTSEDSKIMLWKVGLDKPILVKQRAYAFCEVLFVPQSKDVCLIACNWNTGTIYLFKVGK